MPQFFGECEIFTGEIACHKFLDDQLPIDFSAVADAEDQHDQAVILDFADKPVITGAVFPEFSQARAL